MKRAIITVTVSVPLASDFEDLEPGEAAQSVADAIDGTCFGKYPAKVLSLKVEEKKP